MSDSTTVGSDNKPNVNKNWQTKFDLLEKIGADEQFIYKALSSSAYKELNFNNKQKISFNIWAFLFGAFYYFAKKMWIKGAVILGIVWTLSAFLTLIENIAGFSFPGIFYWIPSAVICSQMANYDYFRSVKYNEKLWPGLPDILTKPVGFIGFPVAAFILLVVFSAMSPSTSEDSNSLVLDEVSGVWRADSDAAMVNISLLNKKKSLTINGKKIPVIVNSIDHDNNVITLSVNANGQEVLWTLRQLIADDDTFNLQMTLHNGTQDELSFVRNL